MPEVSAGALSPETSNPPQLVHWKISTDRDDILWVVCDRANESTNSLSQAVLKEFNEVVNYAGSLQPAGMVITSAKENGFIAGADIREFEDFEKAEDVTALITEGHQMLMRLENLPFHTVAAVHGFCLGGGLELALACDYIIALNTPNTRIGLPEVQLGIFPGLGGTVRMTERVGGLKGMELMLTGRLLRASVARGMGVVDELVEETGSLKWAARRAVMKKRKPRKLSKKDALSNSGPLRKGIATMMRKQTAAKANPNHYPSPFELIDLWEEHRGDRAAMFKGEAEAVGRLMVSDTSKNLRRIFYLTERMKGLGKVEGLAFDAKRIHVVGAGVMGGDIAAWCVVQGMEVTLQDREMKYIKPALKRAAKLFKKRFKTKAATSAAVSRLMPDVDGKGAERADVVIEAIYEDRDAKRELYASLEPRMRPHAVLATNTSAIPLEELSSGLENPARLIGLHFFNPVAKMQLVEVVHADNTDQGFVDKGAAFCTQINRFPLPTRSSPGFLVNRVLAPYLMEAMTMHIEGTDKETLDAAAEQFGMPMGPIELADIVGLDVCKKVSEILPGEGLDKERKLLDDMIERKHLGKKTGQGFYEWSKGKPVKKSTPGDNAHHRVIADRLIKPFLDECKKVSAEGIVADDDLLDAGIIFGTGFAPFHGGPMNYLENREKKASKTTTAASAAAGASA